MHLLCTFAPTTTFPTPLASVLVVVPVRNDGIRTRAWCFGRYLCSQCSGHKSTTTSHGNSMCFPLRSWRGSQRLDYPSIKIRCLSAVASRSNDRAVGQVGRLVIYLNAVGLRSRGSQPPLHCAVFLSPNTSSCDLECLSEEVVQVLALGSRVLRQHLECPWHYFRIN